MLSEVNTTKVTITINADWSAPTELTGPIEPKARVSKWTHKRFYVQMTLMFNGNYKPDSLDILILIKSLQINICSPRKEHYKKSLHSYYTHTFLKNANFQTFVWAFFLNYIDSEVTIVLKTRTKHIFNFWSLSVSHCMNLLSPCTNLHLCRLFCFCSTWITSHPKGSFAKWSRKRNNLCQPKTWP